MVRINGRETTRPYEQIGENLQSLQISIEHFNYQYNLVCDNTYQKFKMLKSDYDSKALDIGTYVEFLKVLQTFFTKYPDWNHPAMHVSEIQAEIKAHCQ